MEPNELLEIKKLMSKGQIDHALNKLDIELTTPASLNTTILCELLYLKAVCLRMTQQSEVALATLTDLLNANPDYSRAWQEYGYLALNMGVSRFSLQQVADYFVKAVQLNPMLVASWQQLSSLYQTTTDSNLTPFSLSQINAKLKSLTALPREVIAATDLLYDKKIGEAEQVIRKFLIKQPHQPDAMGVLAEIGIQNKVYDDAEFILSSGVELYPTHLQLRYLLCSLLMKLGKYAQALDHADIILNKAKEDGAVTLADEQITTLTVFKAMALSNLGQSDASFDQFEEITARTNTPEILVQWGHALKYAGRLGDAVEKYQEAYQSNPMYGDAYWSLANTKAYKFSDIELQNMEVAVNEASVSSVDKIHFEFALGKAREDRRQFTQSFNHYQSGNKLKAKTLNYQPELTSQLVDSLIRDCDTQWRANLKENGTFGCTDDSPIFILGLPRAGSTLLEQILASHSLVEGTMELHNILSLALKMRGKSGNASSYPKRLREIDPKMLEKLGAHYIANTQSYRSGSPYFIDKMPNNFMHIGLIKAILPNAKIIDARREPMACCFSGFKQLFGDGQDFSYDLNWLSHYYNDYVRLMDHWHEVFPGEILTVQHEHLLEDTEGQIRRLLGFCGLDFEPGCVSFYETKRNVMTPSSEQVRQPIFKSSVNQWRHYEDQLVTLSEQLAMPSIQRSTQQYG